jgi:hypothetical protein
MSIDWDADVKRWIWERGVFHLVTGAGDERTDPQFMAFYDVQLSVSELERVNIADKVLPQVQADTGRGRRISDVYGLWMAELCHHILVNGSPDPSRVGATIDDVNVAIGVHRERYPDTTENYREVSRSSIVDHATAVIKLMHARDVLGKPYP